MTKEYSNEEFGFGSNAYADPAPIKKEENKIAKSPSAAPKITDAAMTATAAAANAAEPAAPVASAPALPPLPPASAGAPPRIKNPAQTGDFWESALTGVGIPVGVGLASGAAGAYLLNKFGSKTPNGAVAPTVESNAPVSASMAQLEELKIKMMEHDLAAKQAAEQRAAASYEADQRRADAIHERIIAEKEARIAKQAAASIQNSQGKAYNNQDNTIISNTKEMEMKAAAANQNVEKYKQPDPVMQQKSIQANAAEKSTAQLTTPEEVVAQQAQKAIPQQQAPAPIQQAPAPVPESVAPVAQQNAPVVPAPEKVAAAESKLTKEQKGMKNYLVAQYGGGPEGEAAYKKVIDILGEVPAYEKGKGGGLTPEANNAIKDWRKANIEGPKVNLTHDMKKVMKGAGGLAILTALPGFAEAAQRKDVGKMTDIFTDFFVLPFAQSRGTNEGEEQELAKRRYEGAVGGGRGIAPPSFYLR